MTKEITKAFILQQMQDKLGLREFEPETFLFSELVVPTYSIEPHLRTWGSFVSAKSISSGPVGVLFFTVPANEKWVLRGFNVVFMASGAYTVTGVYLVRVTGGSMIYLDMVEGQTVSYAKNLPQMVTLHPGDKIYVYIDAYVSTANLNLYIDVRKEEIR